MLREINLEDIGKYAEEEIYLLHEEAVYSLEEFRPLVRVLVDEEEDEEDPERYEFGFEEDDEDEDEDDDEDDEPEDLPFPDDEAEDDPDIPKAPDCIRKRVKRTPDEIRALIQEAVDAGCKKRSEIMKYTGLFGASVDKYWDKEDESES